MSLRLVFTDRGSYDFMHFERHFAFQNAYDFIFQENLKKILGLTSKFR